MTEYGVYRDGDAGYSWVAQIDEDGRIVLASGDEPMRDENGVWIDPETKEPLTAEVIDAWLSNDDTAAENAEGIQSAMDDISSRGEPWPFAWTPIGDVPVSSWDRDSA